MKFLKRFLLFITSLILTLVIIANYAPVQEVEASSVGFSTYKNKVFQDGEEIRLYGVNWFGFDDEGLRIHAAWQRSVQDMITQIKSFGFNAVRVPICAPVLDNLPTDFIDEELNPEYAGQKSLNSLDIFLSDLAENGLYFILDHHSIDCQDISPLWYTDDYSEEEWISDLEFVARRYSLNPYFVGMDLKNENHSVDGKNHPEWGTGNKELDWREAAQKAGQAVNQTNPNILIFVSGIENGQTDCSKDSDMMWGENFMPVACYPIDSSMIPEDRLIYTPHIYGPDVYPNIKYFSDDDFPENLDDKWEEHFGFLTNLDYTLVPGEFGSKYGTTTNTGKGDPKDIVLQDKLIDYFASKDICNFFYWSYNPNSVDTGGLLEDDWQTPIMSKVNNINRLTDYCEKQEKVNLEEYQKSQTQGLLQKIIERFRVNKKTPSS